MIPQFKVIITHDFLDTPQFTRQLEPFFPSLEAAFLEHSPINERHGTLDKRSPNLWEFYFRDRDGKRVKMTFRMTDEEFGEPFNEEVDTTLRKPEPPRFK